MTKDTMMNVIDPKHFAAVAKALTSTGAHQAIKYLGPKSVLKATRRGKLRARDSRQEFVFTMGAPAFRETKFIKQAIAAGEPFPIKKIQVRFKPAKK